MKRLSNSMEKYLNLDGVQIIGSGFYFTPTKYVMRGYCIDRTSTKDEYYLWEFISPLFSPLLTGSGIRLSYSRRLQFTEKNDDTLTINRETISSIAHDIVQPRLTNKSDFLVKIDDPSFFCHSYPVGNNVTTNIDLAMAHFLAEPSNSSIENIRDLYLHQVLPTNHALLIERVKPIYEITFEGEEKTLKFINNLIQSNRTQFFPSLL
jgi:hypothetical protein